MWGKCFVLWCFILFWDTYFPESITGVDSSGSTHRLGWSSPSEVFQAAAHVLGQTCEPAWRKLRCTGQEERKSPGRESQSPSILCSPSQCLCLQLYRVNIRLQRAIPWFSNTRSTDWPLFMYICLFYSLDIMSSKISLSLCAVLSASPCPLATCHWNILKPV